MVGAERTAEELGRAFPQTPVRQSVGGRTVAQVPDTPAIVVATPGAEPPAEGGYAGAVLLDTALLLLRPDLRAAEEALRRWLNVVALVRSGADGGSVIAVGESAGRALQALVRVDPAGFAARELAERAEARIPAGGQAGAGRGRPPRRWRSSSSLARLPEQPRCSARWRPGTMPGDDLPVHRLTLRAPARSGRPWSARSKEAVAIRSARKSEGALRVVVDPVRLG